MDLPLASTTFTLEARAMISWRAITLEFKLK